MPTLRASAPASMSRLACELVTILPQMTWTAGWWALTCFSMAVWNTESPAQGMLIASESIHTKQLWHKKLQPRPAGPLLPSARYLKREVAGKCKIRCSKKTRHQLRDWFAATQLELTLNFH